MKPLQIGDKLAKLPLIQGGMGVGVSLSRLAGAVAYAGGIGIISTAQIGFREADFQKDTKAANLRAMVAELKKARDIAANADGKCQGLIGYNIMVATKDYADYVRTAARAGADVIISGAGLPVDLPEYVTGTGTKIAPIVSSEKAARIILKMWDRRYKRTADFVVIEGAHAGGHLGFSREELAHLYEPDYEANYDDEIRRIVTSPVGMPGRAIHNAFLEKVAQQKEHITHCFRCLEKCNPAQAPYCITQALIRAVEGDVENGLIFCGDNVQYLDHIGTVEEVVHTLFPES